MTTHSKLYCIHIFLPSPRAHIRKGCVLSDFLGAEGLPPEPVTPSTQINLEALFMQATSLGSDTAKRQNQKNTK